MESNGWIKLHRSLLGWEWYNDVNTKMLFLHLLLKANYEDKKWQGIDIPKGSCITSINHLAEELNLTPRKIRTSLNHLILTKEVTIQTTKKYTRVIIENWEKYQCYDNEIDKANDKGSDNPPTQYRQQHKNIKNININILNKYIGDQPKTLFEKMKLIREIKAKENLTPEQESEIENYILGVE